MTIRTDPRQSPAPAAPSIASPGPAARPEHPSAWALWPTLGATWIAFAQVVSFQGLAIWVVGGSILTALVVVPIAMAGRRVLAVAAVACMTFATPLAAEWIGGDSAGPITRACLMACAATAAMSLILPSRYPMAVLVPALLLLGGALGLGAAGSAAWLVGAWVVAAAVTVAILGPYRNDALRDRTRLRWFSLSLVAVGVVAVAALAVASPVLDEPWTIAGATVGPGPTDIPSTDLAETPAAPVAPPATTLVDATDRGIVVTAVVVAVVVLAVVIIVTLLRRSIVAVRWWMTKRRLMRGTPDERAIGAWTWVRLRRARYDSPLPVSASPDVAVDWARADGEPDILVVAEIASRVAFNPSGAIDSASSSTSWSAATSAGRRPQGASLRQRWQWSGRRP